MAQITLNTDHVIMFEEEKTLLARPTTPFTNAFSVEPISGSVVETPNIVRSETASGYRSPTRRILVGVEVGWSMQVEIHPVTLGWFLKWTAPSLYPNPAAGEYCFVFPATCGDVKSSSIYIWHQQEDFYGPGEEVLTVLGNKITALRAEGSVQNNDERILLTVEGAGVKPLLETELNINIIDQTNLDQKAISFSINGTTHTFTAEAGSPSTNEFQIGVTPTDTATNLKTLIETNVDGVFVSNQGGLISVSAANGFRLSKGSTTADDATVTIETIEKDEIMGLPTISAQLPDLYNSASWSSYLISGSSFRYDTNPIRNNPYLDFTLEIANDFRRRSAATSTPSVYPDRIFLGSQAIGFSFTREFAESPEDFRDYQQQKERALDISFQHKLARNALGQRYITSFQFPRFGIDQTDNRVTFGGGNDETVVNFQGAALVGNKTSQPAVLGSKADFTPNFSSGAHWVASGFTIGSTTTVTAVTLRAKTDSLKTTKNLLAEIYADNAGSPDTSLLAISKVVRLHVLNPDTYTVLRFRLLTVAHLPSGTYHVVFKPTTVDGDFGAGAVIFEHSANGVDSTYDTTNSGSSWNVNPNVSFNKTIEGNDVLAVIRMKMHTSASTLYPDAT